MSNRGQSAIAWARPMVNKSVRVEMRMRCNSIWDSTHDIGPCFNTKVGAASTATEKRTSLCDSARSLSLTILQSLFDFNSIDSHNKVHIPSFAIPSYNPNVHIPV